MSIVWRVKSQFWTVMALGTWKWSINTGPLWISCQASRICFELTQLASIILKSHFGVYMIKCNFQRQTESMWVFPLNTNIEKGALQIITINKSIR